MKWVRGSALPLVLGVLLVMSILVTGMLRLPGTVRRTVKLVANETQEMYLAESAVLAKLNGFPECYFAELPVVESRWLGPWTEWRTDKFHFLLGNEYGRFATSEWARCAVTLEQNLRERILQSDGLKSFSGNRRFFELDSSATVSPMALNIAAGDLTVDLGGGGAFENAFDGAFENARSPRKSIRSFMANVEGDVKIRGGSRFDTLRIYSTGTVTLQQNVSADFAEIFGAAGVTVAGNVSLTGALLSKQNIEVLDHAKLNFPSFAIAVGYRGNRVALRGKSAFGGLAIAPSGELERDSSVAVLDSATVLLPFCMDSRLVVFDRRRL